ncbi:MULTISPECIES: hypothetical protein [unclassified Microcoleus]|uniref:hypothetical protein n=1 Tax=unclassified Microcoleus TaxID=2642155 RepID=UPI0025F79BAC|nr:MULTISPECIES: hypothetical protein [unclassified Microcoleus]
MLHPYVSSPPSEKSCHNKIEDYGEIKNMTREELLQLIDKAADEAWTELDLAGLGLEELPPEIGKCTQLEKLVLGKFDMIVSSIALFDIP